MADDDDNDRPDELDLSEPGDLQVPDLAEPQDLRQIGRRHRKGERVGMGLSLFGSCLGVYLSQRRRRSPPRSAAGAGPLSSDRSRGA